MWNACESKMKRVGSIKQALKPSIKSNSATSDAVNNNESKVNDSKMNNSSITSSPNRMSILGNVEPRSNGLSSKPDFHLPKSISSFLKKGTLTRNKKDKSSPVIIFKNFIFLKSYMLLTKEVTVKCSNYV